MKNHLSKKLVTFLVIMTVCGLLIFFNPKRITDPFRGVFLRVSYPFQKTFYLLSQSLGNTLDFLGSISSLKDENKKLVNENNFLAAEVAALKETKAENEILREQLNLIPREKFNLEPAFVIGQDPQRLGNWIIIDKGENDGLSPGMPVIVSDGILVGKIDAVYGKSSKVNLLTEAGSAVNAQDADTSAKGIAKGEYGLGITLDLVAQADILNTGDTIITSGLGGDLPKGLFIGKIQEIRSSSDQLFQQAIITPRIVYSKLSVVFVIKN